MIKEVTRIIIFSPYMTGLLSLHGKAQFLYKELAVVTIIFKNYSMSACWILDGNYSSHWGACCQVGQNHSDQTIESELDIEAILAVMNTTELVIEIRPKKFRPIRDLNLWPLWYQCSTLPTELTSQLGTGHYFEFK